MLTIEEVLKNTKSLINFYKDKNKYGQAGYWKEQLERLEMLRDLEFFPVKFYQVHMKIFETYKKNSKRRAMARKIPTSMLIK